MNQLHIENDLSDEQLLALSRMLLSMHTQAVSVRRDDEAEKRTLIQHKIDELFDECYRRCNKSNDLLRLGQLVPLLYQLATPCLVPINNEKLLKCDAQAERSTDLWIAQGATNWEEEHGMMRVTIELMDAMEDPEQEPVFQKYKHILTEWEQTLSGNQKWDGISEMEAHSRLEIMHCFS